MRRETIERDNLELFLKRKERQFITGKYRSLIFSKSRYKATLKDLIEIGEYENFDYSVLDFKDEVDLYLNWESMLTPLEDVVMEWADTDLNGFVMNGEYKLPIYIIHSDMVLDRNPNATKCIFVEYSGNNRFPNKYRIYNKLKEIKKYNNKQLENACWGRLKI